LGGLLRAESPNKILIYLLCGESGYGKGIADYFSIAQDATQKQLASHRYPRDSTASDYSNTTMVELATMEEIEALVVEDNAEEFVASGPVHEQMTTAMSFWKP
jgi:hypothetical protein